MSVPVFFRSTTGGAPALSGTAGSLIAVLDYCLVTGLGWTKVYAGTNRAVYRPPAGVRDYYDFNDTGSDPTQLAKNAVVSGYETMSAIGVGTQQYPQPAQTAGTVGVAFRKSNTADATVRPWWAVGDDRTFYFTCDQAGSGFVGLFGLGEFYSYLATDNNRTMLAGCLANGTGIGGQVLQIPTVQGTFFTITSSSVLFMKRAYHNLGTPAHFSPASHGIWYGQFNLSGLLPGPDPADSNYRVNTVSLFERGTGTTPVTGMQTLRGRWRGIWQWNHPDTGFTDGDTIAGRGALTGRSFVLCKFLGTSGPPTCAIETTAWDTSS